MAILLILQTMPLSAIVFAQDLPINPEPITDNSGTTTGTAITLAAPSILAGSTDKTQVLNDANPSFSLKVKQGNPLVEKPENSELNGRSNFTIELSSVRIPVLGDNPQSDGADIILKNDTVILDRETYFKGVQITATGSVPIKIGNDTIATITFASDKITILFNGNDIFFGGGKQNVNIAFSVTCKAANETPGAEEDTSIFGYPYKLKNPPLVPAYSIIMQSNSNNTDNAWINTEHFRDGYIEWKATVKAFDKDNSTINMPLDGTKFYSDLTNVGTYAEGSFKIDGNAIEPNINGNVLSYDFPNISTDENQQHTAIVTFRTWIPKSKYYTEYNTASGNQTIANSAKLQNIAGTDDLAVSPTSNGGYRVVFRPDWIQMHNKRVLKVENGEKYITWTIEVNSTSQSNLIKQNLKNFKITAPLPTGANQLSFVSAEYKLWETNKWGTASSITPDADGVYTGSWSDDGTLNTRVQLVIKTKVDNGSSFTLTAKTNWDLDTPSGAIQDNDASCNVSDYDTITIGSHSFSKSGTIANNEYNIGAIKWTVGLNLQYDVDNAAVYDVLVHGDDLDVLDNIDTNPEISQEMLTKIKTQLSTKPNQIRWLWQKYKANSLTSANGLTLKNIPIYKNGEHVADLIKATGFKGEANANFSFDALVTNPDILFRQNAEENKTRENYALLFDGDNYQAHAGGYVNLHIRMLNKEMLYASKPLDANNNEVKAPTWNRPTSTNSWAWVNINDKNLSTLTSYGDNYIIAAYDRVSKTATFRLAVNMPGYKTDLMSQDGGSREISDITLVDTLPDGWEFVEYAPGKDYELYKGYSDNSSGANYGQSCRADNVIPQGDLAHVVSFSKNNNVGTFTFTKLESPYVILVKARPTNEALKNYDPGLNTVENTATFSMKFGDTLKSATEKHKIIVPLMSLSKTASKPVSGVQEWTVNYTPPFNMKSGVYLQDTLGVGLKLRKDIDDELSLLPSDLAVYRGLLNPNGTLTRVGAPLDLSDPDCEVRAEVIQWGDATKPTKLIFHMDNPNNFYQIVYQTESSKGMSTGSVGNKIELLGDDTLPMISAQSSVSLDSNDVSGNASDTGMLYLKKVKPDGTTPLKDVKFKLFNPDGTPARDKNNNEIEEKATGADGKTNFIIQIPGEYILKQTYIDETTWLPTTTEYRVRVIDAPGCPVLVDGKKVDINNPLIVPTPAIGELKISNTVTGKDGEQNKEFEYTITFEDEGKDGSYFWKKSDNTTSGTDDRIKSGSTFKLKHGESLTLPALLVGMTYTVIESNYAADGYTTNPVSRIFTETIINNGKHVASFINNRVFTGKLMVSNTVIGNGADISKDFSFTIKLKGDGENDSYTFTKYKDGVATGTDTLSNGKTGYTLTMKHGESIVIDGLPRDIEYNVTEDDYSSDVKGGYTTNPNGLKYEGIIIKNERAEAVFINEKWLPGSLLISNTVTGNGADPNKEFEYIVSFGEGETYYYAKKDINENISTGTIASGGKIKLKHGDSIEIQNIPKGVNYTVIQNNYNNDGYTTNPNVLKHTGIIESNTQSKVPFQNYRQKPGTLDLKVRPANTEIEPSDIAKVPGDEKHPTELIAILVDDIGKPVGGKEITFYHENGTILGKATTDTDGKAVYLYTPPKVNDTVEHTYKFTATTDYRSSSGVPYDKSNEVEVIAAPAALFGVLRDNNTGNIIKNASITITNIKTGEAITIKTDENGAYSHPVDRDEEYTITYNKEVTISGVKTYIPFTQKANTEDISAEFKDIPAEITAVGIVLFKNSGSESNANSSLLKDTFSGELNVYLKDKDGNYVVDIATGNPKAFPLDKTYGTFTVPGLSEQVYTLELRGKVGNTELTLIKDKKLNVQANGELNISEQLVDPYGTVTDKATGDIIEDAEITLYYANTQRNKDNGKVPGTKVKLPKIIGFAPNDNESPSQNTDINGKYAYMVYPDTDYYLVAEKTGYATYTSETISVGVDIVLHDIQMSKENSGSIGNDGNNGNDSTPNNNGAAQSYGKIVIKSIDEDGKAISEVEFTLYDSEGNVVGKVTTDSDGIASFDNIKSGNYVLKETKGPDGYDELIDKSILIIVDGNKTIESIFIYKNTDTDSIPQNPDTSTDEKDESGVTNNNSNTAGEKDKPENSKGTGSLPNTGEISYRWLLEIIGALLIITGILLGRRKKYS